MLRRRYPDRIQNVDQESTRKCIRLSHDADLVLAKLISSIGQRWSPEEVPSISLIISKALCFYADRITYDPKRLEAAYLEFVEESRTRQEEKNYHV